LLVTQVKSKNVVEASRKLLGKDPTNNILPLGDLYSPLFENSTVFAAIENEQIMGVCAVYHAFKTPSVVLGNTTNDVKQSLLKHALEKVSGTFISTCPLEDVPIFNKCSTVISEHREQQMTADPPNAFVNKKVSVRQVEPNELESLNTFYLEQGAEAWVPLQVEVGPYYCVKQNGKIVSAAGVHIVTPQIAQLGNIITDEGYRNQGFATACTTALATHLASNGRIISLFVREDNTAAIRIYEKLGFNKHRDIAFLVMQK
jgi:ribosomal protein S18 acetylase RimI-like enzyme